MHDFQVSNLNVCEDIFCHDHKKLNQPLNQALAPGGIFLKKNNKVPVTPRHGKFFSPNTGRGPCWSGWSWCAPTNRATLGFMFVILALPLSKKTAFTGLEGVWFILIQYKKKMML